MHRRLLASLVIALPACSIDQRSPLVASPGDSGVSTPTSNSSTPDATAAASEAGVVDTPGSDAANPNADAGSTVCVAGAPACSCAGCSISGGCIAAGATLPGNVCLICDPVRSSVGYSPNTAATCGAGPSECSAQDTCSALGQCLPNDSPNGAHCGAGGAGLFCIAGQCTTCGAADAPDALCLADSATTPLCDRDRGACAACLPSSCTGATPHCDPTVGCLPCTEHSDCPDSACHLSGPSQGQCFNVGQVVQIPDADTLRTQINILTPEAPRVLVLGVSTYTFDAFMEVLGGGQAGPNEVAVLGQPGSVLSGGGGQAPGLLNVDSNAIVYLSGFSFSDCPATAVGSSQGSILWLDDMQISAYGSFGVSGAGEGHIRRSRVRSDASAQSVAVLWQSGELHLENSALGPGGSIGLQSIGEPMIDVRYSTLAGSTAALSCDASPGPSGGIRNSILIGTTEPTVDCALLGYTGNATDETGLGNQNSVIGHYDPSWFVDAAHSDFHLSASGAAAIGNVATRGGGDPVRDIDGELRPDGAGKPGEDQP